MAQAIATHPQTELRCPKCWRAFKPVTLACGESAERTCKHCGVVVKATVERAPDGQLILSQDFRAA